MGFEVSQVKATLERELDSLRQTADELRVQAALARADAKTECDRLETTLRKVQEDIQRMGEHIKPTLLEFEDDARALLQEIAQGFDRLRQNLQS